MVISTAKEKKQSLGENKEGGGTGPKERGLRSADHPIRLRDIVFSCSSAWGWFRKKMFQGLWWISKLWQNNEPRYLDMRQFCPQPFSTLDLFPGIALSQEGVSTRGALDSWENGLRHKIRLDFWGTALQLEDLRPLRDSTSFLTCMYLDSITVMPCV